MVGSRMGCRPVQVLCHRPQMPPSMSTVYGKRDLPLRLTDLKVDRSELAKLNRTDSRVLGFAVDTSGVTMDMGLMPAKQCALVSELSVLNARFDGAMIGPTSQLVPVPLRKCDSNCQERSVDTTIIDSASEEVDPCPTQFSCPPAFDSKECSMPESVSCLRLPTEGAGPAFPSCLCPTLVLPEGCASTNVSTPAVKVLMPCGSHCLHPTVKNNPQVQVLRFHVVQDRTTFLPKAQHDDKTPWFLLELFSGGFGGWKQASSLLQRQLNIPMASLAVEIDHVIAACYVESFKVPVCLFADDLRFKQPIPCVEPYPCGDMMFVGDVSDPSWIKMLPWASRVICTISSPCPPWSKASDKDGLNDQAGRSLIEAIANLRLVRPCLIAMENVDSIRSHPHFQGILDCLKWAGYKLAWESIEDLKDIAPVSRRRWLAVFIPVDSPLEMFEGFGFIPLPPVGIGNYKMLIDLPEAHERALTLSQRLLEIYSDPKLSTKGFLAGNNMSEEADLFNHVMRQRLRGSFSTLATFVAQYGNQHNLPLHALEKRGLFAELFHGKFGPRFFSPCEIAILHGACVPLVFPKLCGHLIVGNCIAVQHALLAMVAGLSMFDQSFKINRCVLNEMILLSRLHAENAEVFVKEDDVWIVPSTHIEAAQIEPCHEIDDSMSAIDAESENCKSNDSAAFFGDDDAIDPTCSFVCGCQVHCEVGGIQHVLHADGSLCLNDVLLTNGLHEATKMVAVNHTGQPMPGHVMVETDLHLSFLTVSAQVKEFCETGMTWIICKAGKSIERTKGELLGPLSHLEVVAWDIALWPVNPCLIKDSDTFLFLTLKGHECFPFDFCDFSCCRNLIPDVDSPFALAHLPVVELQEDGITFAASNNDVIGTTFALVEAMLDVLKNVFSAANWEWDSSEDTSQPVFGRLRPKCIASAPARVIVNAVLRFLFETSMTVIAKPAGLHVVLKYNGILFWCGLLDGAMTLECLGSVVHSTLACIGEDLPTWTQGARRIHLEGHLSALSPNSRGNINLYLCSPFHGGGGKTDTWKEAKSLLGKELIERGWPVRGLDEVTTNWNREIGTNKLFGILKQPKSEKRWNALIDAAKSHGIKIEPDEPVRLKAIQKIQKAIRQRAPMNLSATCFQLVPGFFIDEAKNAVKILGTVNLQSSGICLGCRPAMVAKDGRKTCFG
eukprot:s46_g32.t1